MRLIPGPEAFDSPELDEAKPLDVVTWDAWLTLVEDRLADRPSRLEVLATALDTDEPTWNLWWDRQHPRGILTHRAALVNLRTLVSACGYSTPAHPGLSAWEIGGRAIRDSRRTYCAICLRVDPYLPNS